MGNTYTRGREVGSHEKSTLSPNGVSSWVCQLIWGTNGWIEDGLKFGENLRIQEYFRMRGFGKFGVGV